MFGVRSQSPPIVRMASTRASLYILLKQRFVDVYNAYRTVVWQTTVD